MNLEIWLEIWPEKLKPSNSGVKCKIFTARPVLTLFEIQAEEFKRKMKGLQSYPVMHLLVMRLKQKSMQSLSKVNTESPNVAIYQMILW